MTNQLEIQSIGSLNSNDQANELIRRSFVMDQGNFYQKSPVESPDMANIDYDSNGFSKRKGSVLSDDLSSILLTNDSLIKGDVFVITTSNERVEFIVSSKTIYLKRSGIWSQILNSQGDSYTHAFDVSKVSFTKCDGKLFIGLDNSNCIQVYRAGSSLDDQYFSSSSVSTVNSDSLSGGSTLYVSSTDFFNIGDRIILAQGQVEEEIHYISSKDSQSLTLSSNLSFDHLLSQSHEVIVSNQYPNIYGTLNDVITGDIPVGCYLTEEIHGRLVYSNGEKSLYYAPINEPYAMDSISAGYRVTSGRIKALISVTPRFSNSLQELLYIGTDKGFEILSGFTEEDYVNKVEGSRSIFNHQSYAVTNNFLVYLTEDKNIFGINGNYVIDLGRRAKSSDLSGKLDAFDTSESQDTAFGYYLASRKQALFFFSTDTSRVNNRCIVLDFQKGEPLMDESNESLESRVRVLHWEIKSGSWFLSIYPLPNFSLGVCANGKVYQVNTGYADLGEIAIDSYWYSPIFFGVDEFVRKKFIEYRMRGIPKGNFNIHLDVFLDRSNSPSKSFTLKQGDEQSSYNTATYGDAIYSSVATIKNNKHPKAVKEAIQWKLYNSNVNENFVISNQGLRYQHGRS